MLKREEKINPAYISKHNSKREKQAILLIIQNIEKWHYLAVKRLSALLRRITSTHDGDLYCLKCLHSFGAKKQT